MDFKARMEGTEELSRAFIGIKDAMAKKILKKALKAAAAPVLAAIVSLAPAELKPTLKVKVKSYRGGVRVKAIFGPESNVKITVDVKPDKVFRMIRGKRVRIANPRPEQLKAERNASRHAKGVEFGKKDEAAKPFMRLGFKAAESASVAELASVIAAELEALAK